MSGEESAMSGPKRATSRSKRATRGPKRALQRPKMSQNALPVAQNEPLAPTSRPKRTTNGSKRARPSFTHRVCPFWRSLLALLARKRRVLAPVARKWRSGPSIHLIYSRSPCSSPFHPYTRTHARFARRCISGDHVFDSFLLQDGDFKFFTNLNLSVFHSSPPDNINNATPTSTLTLALSNDGYSSQSYASITNPEYASGDLFRFTNLSFEHRRNLRASPPSPSDLTKLYKNKILPPR